MALQLCCPQSPYASSLDTASSPATYVTDCKLLPTTRFSFRLLMVSTLIGFIVGFSIYNLPRYTPYKTAGDKNITATTKWQNRGRLDITIRSDMAPEVADEEYYKFVTHKQFMCETSIRLGKAADGGWDVCLTEPYGFGKPCLVYSFGINNDFSFDDDVSKKYNCTVRAFDPSMNVADHRRDSNIWFYKTGIGGADERSGKGWQLKTLDTTVKDVGDADKIIDYLKMDVEDSEWSSIEAMFKTAILERYVKQFALEIHLFSTKPGTDSFLHRWKIMKQLEDIGFGRWYWHMNTYNVFNYRGHTRSLCYEMVYINTRFLTS